MYAAFDLSFRHGYTLLQSSARGSSVLIWRARAAILWFVHPDLAGPGLPLRQSRRRGDSCVCSSRPFRADGTSGRSWCPWGTFKSARPSMVGTSILAPRPASEIVTGTLISMLSPSRRKNGCGSTRIGDVEIARRSAVPAAFPLPATRRREPDCAPAGMRTSTVSLLHQPSFAMTGGADILEPALSIAARTGETELHRARHLRDVAGAVTFGAHRTVAAAVPGAAAGWRKVPADSILKLNLGAADRLARNRC